MEACRKSQNSILLFGIRATTLLPVLTLMLVVISAEAKANLLTNSDFETGDLTSWTWNPTQYAEPEMIAEVVTFETVLGQPSLCFRVNPGTDDAHYGIGQEEGGILSQTINLVAGTNYAVSVGASAIHYVGPTSNSDGGLIRLYIGGNLQWSWDVGEIGPTGAVVRNSYEGTYVPTFTGPHDFELVFTRTWRNWGGFAGSQPSMYHYADNISVIPEPATLLLVGLGGLVLRRKRRA
jgi:hypothetical protein